MTNTDVNQWPVRVLSCLLFASGTIIYFQLPILGGIFIEHYGFDTRRVGFLLSADMTGAIFGPLSAPLWIHRVAWRPMLFASVLLAFTPNFLICFFDGFYALMGLRYTAGLGQGLCLAFGFSMIAANPNPDREFGFATAAMIATGSLVLLLSPDLIDSIGRDGVFFAIGAFTVIPLFFVKLAPGRNPKATEKEDGDRQKTMTPVQTQSIVLVLLTTVLFFAAMDCVWPFTDRLGDAQGLSKQFIANTLAATVAFSFLGAGSCVLIAGKVKRSLALSGGLLLVFLSFVLLTGELTAERFVIALCLYNYATTFVIPLLNGWIARLDQAGRYIVLQPVMQSVGTVLGPIISGFVIVNEMYVYGIYAGATVLMICLIPFFSAIYLGRKIVEGVPGQAGAMEARHS